MKKYKFVVGKQDQRLSKSAKGLTDMMYLHKVTNLSEELKETTKLLMGVLESEHSVPVTVMHLIDDVECRMLDIRQRVTLGNRYADALLCEGLSSAEAMEAHEELVAKMDEKINQLHRIRDRYKELIELSGKNPAEKVELMFEL